MVIAEYPKVWQKSFRAIEILLGRKFMVLRSNATSQIARWLVFRFTTCPNGSQVRVFWLCVKLNHADARQEVFGLVDAKFQELYPPEEAKMEFDLTPISDVYYQTDVVPHNT